MRRRLSLVVPQCSVLLPRPSFQKVSILRASPSLNLHKVLGSSRSAVSSALRCGEPGPTDTAGHRDFQSRGHTVTAFILIVLCQPSDTNPMDKDLRQFRARGGRSLSESPFLSWDPAHWFLLNFPLLLRSSDFIPAFGLGSGHSPDRSADD